MSAEKEGEKKNRITLLSLPPNRAGITHSCVLHTHTLLEKHMASPRIGLYIWNWSEMESNPGPCVKS